MENGQYVDGSLWFYAPNKVAPVVFAFLFSVSMLLHAYQCYRYKSWKVTAILVFSTLLFVIGYIFREIGAFHFGNVDIYIVSLVFIYVAPPLYELANYFILSRILYYVPYHSPIHPGRVFTTFGAISSVVEILNANGAAYTANSSLTQSQQNTGKALLKAALILQLAILSSFVALAAWFNIRCKKAGVYPDNLKSVLRTLYISSALIGCRTVYRTVEYFTTSSLHFSNVDPSTITPIFRYEWFFWVFEATLMVINTFLLNARHPMRFLPRDNTIYLAEDGVTEIQGPGYLDSRKWYLTFFDPFNIMAFARGQTMNTKFWEVHDEGRAHGSSSDPSQAEKGLGRHGAERRGS